MCWFWRFVGGRELWEVFSLWDGAFINGNSDLMRDAAEFPKPIHNVRTQRKVYSLEKGPHMTIPAP